MTFNEFQRELQRRGIGTQEAYLFTLIYERLLHVTKEVETMARLLTMFANQLQGFVQLREEDQAVLKKVQKGLREDGIGVTSVANDPMDDDR